MEKNDSKKMWDFQVLCVDVDVCLCVRVLSAMKE